MNNFNRLYLHDARQLDLILPASEPCITATITSPPYWQMKDYGVETQIGFGQTKEEYLADIESVLRKVHAATKQDGSLWIVVDDYREDGVLQLLPWEFTDCAKKAGWILRDLIIWDKQHTLPWHVKGQMRNVIEFILFFTKTDKYKFAVDRIKDVDEISRWWVDFPERFNPKGKTPTNIWSIPIRTQGMWRRISEINHHCPFPTELVARIINLSTDPGDLIFDPFAGSGVVLAMAAAMDRLYVGCEINQRFIEMFQKVVKKEVTSEWREILDRKEKITSAEINFERTIMALRTLKYTRQVTKPFHDSPFKDSRTKIRAVLSLATIPRRYERSNDIKLNVSVVIDRHTSDTDAALKRAIERSNTLPLSHYGIESELRLVTLAALRRNERLMNSRFYLYQDYKPRRHYGQKTLRNWLNGKNGWSSAKIPMYSNLAVDVAWVLAGTEKPK